MASGCFFFSVFIGGLLHSGIGFFLFAVSSVSSCMKWAQALSTLLRGVGRLRPGDEKNLVRRERSVGLPGGRNVYRVALGQGHLYRCSFRHRNIWGHGYCLPTVLIVNH